MGSGPSIIPLLLMSILYLGFLIWFVVSIETMRRSLKSLASDSAKVQTLLAEIRDKLGK